MKSRVAGVGIAALQVLAAPCLCGGASAAGPTARISTFATLPDWTGIWETEEAALLDQGKLPATPKLWDQAPYTKAAQRRYAPDGFPFAGATNALAVLTRLGTGISPQGGKTCRPFGFPTIMDVPVGDVLFELDITPEQTLLIGNEATVRHIYTDGRPHSRGEDLWPTPEGDSIGHWQGDTLIVDTIARESGAVGPTPGTAILSDQARFTERLRRIDADTLEDRMTIVDPARFTRPWRFTIRYARVRDLKRMISIDCEHDRDTIGDSYGTAPAKAGAP